MLKRLLVSRSPVKAVKSPLQKLREDISKHADLLPGLYPGNYVIELLCDGIARFKDQDDASFMKSMEDLSSEILSDKLPFKSTQDKRFQSPRTRSRVDDLCRGFSEYGVNVKIWPDISTLEELIGAHQKEFIRENIEEAIKSFPENTKIAFNDLSQQIQGSEASMSLIDFFTANSLFWKTRVYIGKGKPLFSIRTMINDDAPETQKERAFLTNIRSDVAIMDPLSTLGKVNTNNGQEAFWREKNLSIYTALIKMRQDYIDRRRDTNLNRIDQLIKAVTKILNHSEDESNGYKYNMILNEVHKTFNIQQQEFVNGAFSGFFKRTPHAFEERLKKPNDNSFCFPRMLKNILDTYALTEGQKRAMDEIILSRKKKH